ncbi:MAG: group III truncated hemoglobin [Chitinophagales bacterium]|nr:group III truncated hemoglobin [Chitinophagales bacterium]
MEQTKHDIQTREEIVLLVNTFYDRVKADDTIGYIFHEIIGEDWSHHLPVMYSFWETVLFGKAGYMGNPVGKHIELDRRIPLTEQHYERWLKLWTETVDDMFAGETANEAKKKAATMLQLISMKVNMARERGNKSVL